MPTSTMLEIACFNASSAILAAQAGANRIELCSDYVAGGLTPPLSSLRCIRKASSIPINVMIRPRAGDFLYTHEEFQDMKQAIREFKSSASGLVFGILDRENRIDAVRNGELVELAAPVPCTFHRAIDEVEDVEVAIEMVIACGFKNILTSGGERKAWEGAERVGRLQNMFGAKITFILGGGIRSNQVGEIKKKAKVPWVHSAAITAPGEDVDEDEVKRMQQILSNII